MSFELSKILKILSLKFSSMLFNSTPFLTYKRLFFSKIFSFTNSSRANFANSFVAQVILMAILWAEITANLFFSIISLIIFFKSLKASKP